MSDSSSSELAKKLLAHYITGCMHEAGLTVDGDTYAELADVVDQIVDPLEKRLDCVEKDIADLQRRVDNVASYQIWG